MKYVLTILLLIITSVVILTPASAQDADDNACYTGGAMEGKCTSDWHWICGWYVDNWLDKGGWSAYPPTDFPDWCDPISLLPPRPSVDPITLVVLPVPTPGPTPTPPPTHPSAGCVYNGPYYNDYTDFKGGWSLAAPSSVYSDAGCTLFSVTWIQGVVYAPAPYDANALCQEAFGKNAVFTSPPSAVYLCGS